MNQPVRPYPLRQLNEPALYVVGDKTGQKIYPPGMQQPPVGSGSMGIGMGGMGSGMGIGMGMNLGHQQALLAQQNSAMEQLERRRERERETARARPAPPVSSFRLFLMKPYSLPSLFPLEASPRGR